MEIIKSWVIVQLSTKPQEGALQDVVSVVHWKRMISDGVYFAETFGLMSCPTPSETDFTAYSDLTQAQVESWLEAGLNVESIDGILDEKIDLLKNPPVVVLPLPWADNN